jgi:hypothetical protein
MPLPLASLAPLLGLGPTDPAIENTLAALVASSSPLDYETKPYPDATYRNYYALGLSLCFLPSSSGALELDSIDIFNPTAEPPPKHATNSKTTPQYVQPPSPLVVHFADPDLIFPPRKPGEKEMQVARPPLYEILETTKGRDIVKRFGEPTRKGAGGWVGVWLEWNAVRFKNGEDTVSAGVMLELKDPKGAEEASAEQQKMGMGGVWDRAAFWRWGSIKLFRTK